MGGEGPKTTMTLPDHWKEIPGWPGHYISTKPTPELKRPNEMIAAAIKGAKEKKNVAVLGSRVGAGCDHSPGGLDDMADG